MLPTQGEIIMEKKPSVEKPWLNLYPEEIVNKAVEYRTIYDAFTEVVPRRKDLNALYYYGNTFTYEELLEEIDALANAFYGMGVREGDRVTCILPTTPEAITSLYALNKIGAIPNYVDPRFSPDRILGCTQIVEPKIIVVVDAMYHKIAEIRDELNVEKIVVVSPYRSLPKIASIIMKLKNKKIAVDYDDVVIDWEDLLTYGENVIAEKIDYKDGSIAAVTYTGGTTGIPKGVGLTNDGLNTLAESFERIGADANEGDSFLEIMPLATSYGIGCGVHMPLIYGACLILIPIFTPDELGKLIRKYRPNHMLAVPAFYERIMRSKHMRNFNLSFLKTTGCGGDTMNISLEHQFNDFLANHGCKYPVSQGYGLSEMTGATTCCFNNVYKEGSVGVPLMFTNAGIFDQQTGEELGYNEYGEVCLTGRNMMAGYYNNQEETDLVMRKHADGNVWVHTGDIGYMDEDGFLYIKGRLKRVVVRFDGHKVFPLNIETVLDSRPEVRTAAVVAIPDKTHAQGETPLAVVQLDNEAVAGRSLEELRKELLDFCDKKCEERGRPGDLVFIDDMPLTPMGKHDYLKIAKRYKFHQVKPR